MELFQKSWLNSKTFTLLLEEMEKVWDHYKLWFKNIIYMGELSSLEDYLMIR